MFYNPTKENVGLFLAGLSIQEEIYKDVLTKQIFEFLQQNVSLVSGSVVDVAPHRNQYFSKASRFLVLSVQGDVSRNNETGIFNGIEVVLNGLFLDDEGNPFQPPAKQALKLSDGSYYLEQMGINGEPMCAIGKLSDNQMHTINLPNS